MIVTRVERYVEMMVSYRIVIMIVRIVLGERDVLRWVPRHRIVHHYRIVYSTSSLGFQISATLFFFVGPSSSGILGIDVCAVSPYHLKR